MATPQGFPLGSGARPADGAEFARRVRAAAVATAGQVSLLGVEVDGFDRAGIDAVLDGADIASLAIDLTGLSVALPSPTDDDAHAPEASTPAPRLATEIDRTAAQLRSGTITAHPTTLVGAPIDLDVALEHVPFDWVERSDGTLELDSSASSRRGLRAARATATISIAQEDLGPLAAQLVTLALTDAGVSVSDVVVALTSADTDRADVDAAVRARYGPMSAKVRLRGTVSIIDGRVVRFDDLDLSTSNLLAGALLGLARGELEKFDGQEFDLAEHLPSELGEPEVHLDVTETTLTVRAAIGA